MTEPKDLLLVNEQLRRSIRRWRVLALTTWALLLRGEYRRDAGGAATHAGRGRDAGGTGCPGECSPGPRASSKRSESRAAAVSFIFRRVRSGRTSHRDNLPSR